jgi:hypothetical protein
MELKENKCAKNFEEDIKSIREFTGHKAIVNVNSGLKSPSHLSAPPTAKYSARRSSAGFKYQTLVGVHFVLKQFEAYNADLTLEKIHKIECREEGFDDFDVYDPNTGTLTVIQSKYSDEKEQPRALVAEYIARWKVLKPEIEASMPEMKILKCIFAYPTKAHEYASPLDEFDSKVSDLREMLKSKRKVQSGEWAERSA